MTPVFGENDSRAAGAEYSRQSRVKERCVLMCVQDLDLTIADFAGEAEAQLPVESRVAVQAHDVHALVDELLTQLADFVQAEDRGTDSLAQLFDDFRDKHFRPGHLHCVHHEADAQALALRLASGRRANWSMVPRW